MSGESAAEDRTEAPTQRRLEQAREQGQLPVSRDLTMLASLGGAVIGGLAVGPMAVRRMAAQAGDLLGVADRVSVEALGGPLAKVLAPAGLLVGAIALPAAACAILCVLLQTSFYVGKTPIRFQPERLNPMAGLARLLSRQHLMDVLKSIAQLAILCALVWAALARKPAESIATIGADALAMLATGAAQVQSFARPLLVMLAVFAVLDLFAVRFQHGRRMRMTREQVRLEHRESEGDPALKGKLRRIRMRRARQRMMQNVKTADVVVTNPTHYAIALKYESGGNQAPRVVAKGLDFVAARIREEAAAHGIPLLPNPPLARALYQVELDHEIPAEHFRAVAEVIAYVWKLKRRAGGPVRP